ncbi:MAG: Rpn family recombination-promoting nuclease/putative transposase [Magnetococcales bacterium]|nr:Rpn family recombination-promoting nuclease/putative transposase [Magnetococcales bacterium]
MTDHDGIYHELYSNPHMMADLLRQFVTEPWIQNLDLAKMEPVKTKFHVPGLPKRTSDVIWRIPARSESDVYLLVLLEFQSKSDQWMVLRVVVYMCLLWLQLLHEKRIPAQGPLPPLFPVVLYNGDTPWLTPVSLRDLIGLPNDSPLWKYQPDAKFFLIDENRFPIEDLQQRDSLSALVFLVEQCRSPDDLPTLTETIIKWLEFHPEFAELRQSLATMILNAMNVLSGDTSLSTDHPIDLLKVPTMLQTRMEAWRDAKLKEYTQFGWMDGVQIGELRGLHEGEKKGRQKERASALLRILNRRFPNLPAWVEPKILAADLQTLDVWMDRALDTDSLQCVFDDTMANEILLL